MIYTQIRFRQGTKDEWLELNPVLSIGEPGYETDTQTMKVGNGVNTWNELPYSNSSLDLKEYIDKGLSDKISGAGESLLNGIIESIPGYHNEEVFDDLGNRQQDKRIPGEIEIIFEKPFNSPPVVNFSVIGECWSNGFSFGYHEMVVLKEIRNDGFIIRNHYKNDIKVTWVAIGK